MLSTGCAGAAFDAQERFRDDLDSNGPPSSNRFAPGFGDEQLIEDPPTSESVAKESVGNQDELVPGQDQLNISSPSIGTVTPPSAAVAQPEKQGAASAPKALPPDSAKCEEGTVTQCTIKLPTHNGVSACIEGLKLCADGRYGECLTVETAALLLE